MPPSQPSALTLEAILEHNRLADLHRIQSLLDKHGPDAPAVLAALRQEHQSAPIVTLFRKGMNIVWSALNVADEKNRPLSDPAGTLAADLAVLLVRTYARPEGGFLEYDWNSWVPAEDMWRTIPWGTAFHGHVMLEVWTRLGARLPETERAFWTAHLERTGAWIFKNPVCGSFVFNCGLHLLSLLWRLGKTFDRAEWTQWALATTHHRLARDVDAEGWITAENGGVSGVYQPLGAGFLAQFARESGDARLQETSRKMLELHARFASRELQWAGNFGTRSSSFGLVNPLQIIEEAAAGNGHAAALLRRCVTLAWTDSGTHTQTLFHPEVWRRAFATTPTPEPVQGATDHFPAIESSVVRAGGFHASFFNYAKSLWARGFASLSHSTGPVFSTLHSLPTEIEKSKMLLGDTSDWAGFPHVRIDGPGGPWNSQQRMSPLNINTSGVVTVTWTEDLLNSAGEAGGTASFSCRFEENALLLGVELADLSGGATLDFHLQRETGKFTGYWLGEEVRQIRAGIPPADGGQFWDRDFAPAATRLAAVQLETVLYTWELLEFPGDTQAVLGLRKSDGLHTQNRGGIRLRLQWPATLRQGRVLLKFSITSA